MATPHIAAEETAFAKTVLMPGDPLRAKFIAETFLEDAVEVTSVRNMFGYTGTYRGKKVSVMGSGMGMPSIGIYSYELFKFYGVEQIIRIGSAGAYSDQLKLYDTVLATSAFSESSFAETAFGFGEREQLPSAELNAEIEAAAEAVGVPLAKGKIHSSDVFYRGYNFDYETFCRESGALCVEMESFALFANARHLGKKAACLLTISDSFVTKEATDAAERQTSFTNMMKVALEAAVRGEQE